MEPGLLDSTGGFGKWGKWGGGQSFFFYIYLAVLGLSCSIWDLVP